jgi:hypothetical protein
MDRGINPGEPGWMILVSLLVPLVPVLLAIGIAYEVVVRIDRRPLIGAFVHWLAAGLLVAAVVAGLALFARA